MYTDWFKLKKLPFRLRPDPEFLFLGAEAGPVLDALRAAFGNGHGVVALTGEAGVGKTTVLHALAQERRGAMAVARVQQPNLTAEELVATLTEQFGLPRKEPGRDGAARLAQFVAEETGHGRTVLILVDEAHRCAPGMLRELTSLAARRPAPLIVLAGEPDLSRSLAALDTPAAPLALIAALQLPRLTQAQIDGYVTFRLHVAGGNGRVLFDPDTMPEIMRYTGGTPQLINTLCDAAMTLAETHNTQRVGTTEIRDAVQELKWVEFSARAPAATDPPDNRNSGHHRVSAHPVIPELEVQQSGRHLTRLTLQPGRLVVGRAEDAGLRLDSQFVSRQHCQLITTAEQTFVEDLGSTNGILVNGKRRKLYRLAPDDRIVIGDHTLIYSERPADG
jgi:general secretion pathway protein A